MILLLAIVASCAVHGQLPSILTIGFATMDPGERNAQGMCRIRGWDTTIVPDVIKVQQKNESQKF
jgi:hypothetical protein